MQKFLSRPVRWASPIAPAPAPSAPLTPSAPLDPSPAPTSLLNFLLYDYLTIGLVGLFPMAKEIRSYGKWNKP